MKALEFCYWVRNLIDLNNTGFDATQIQLIKQNLDKVFINELSALTVDPVGCGAVYFSKYSGSVGPTGPRG
jgi:hypothetical protein